MCSACGCSHHHAEDHDRGHHHHGDADGQKQPSVEHDLLRIEQDILAENDVYAAQNRLRLDRAGVFAINLISSPGSGKTTLLVRTIERLKSRLPISVVVGDQSTSIDAERVRATGVASIQINTGRGCHLDAHMVGHALESLPLRHGSLLVIENIGNLVCPAGFDLGEAQKVVILSVTEGEDKPLKYPEAFAAAKTMVLTKIDLAPHVDFDVGLCIEHARAINPGIAVMQVSARNGEGMGRWVDWLIGATKAADQMHAEPAGHA